MDDALIDGICNDLENIIDRLLSLSGMGDEEDHQWLVARITGKVQVAYMDLMELSGDVKEYYGYA